MTRPRHDTVRAVLLLALHASVLVVLVATPLHQWVNEESVRAFVARTGWYGPIVLLGLCVVTPLFMVPRWPLAMAGGMLYGTLLGGSLANVGSGIGAVVGMLFARYMARAFVARRLGPRRKAFDRLTERHGVVALVAFRAVPFTNFAVTNSLAGMSSIRVLPYALASFAGMIPSSFVYAFMGKVAKRADKGLLLLFGVVFVVFSVATLALGRKLFHRLSARPEPQEPDASTPEAPAFSPPPGAPPPTSTSQS